MTKEHAYRLLGLSDASTLEQIRNSYQKAYNETRTLATNAPTTRHRVEYNSRLGELEEAYNLLTNAKVDLEDLPFSGQVRELSDEEKEARFQEEEEARLRSEQEQEDALAELERQKLMQEEALAEEEAMRLREAEQKEQERQRLEQERIRQEQEEQERLIQEKVDEAAENIDERSARRMLNLSAQFTLSELNSNYNSAVAKVLEPDSLNGRIKLGKLSKAETLMRPLASKARMKIAPIYLVAGFAIVSFAALYFGGFSIDFLTSNEENPVVASAETTSNSSSTISPQDYDAILEKARIFALYGNLKESISLYEKLEDANPDDPELEKRISALYEKFDRAENAIPPTIRSLEKSMVRVRGGSYNKGCAGRSNWEPCEEDERPLTKEKVDNFKISKFEVTQALWKSVMGTDPSYYRNCDDCPVEQVSYFEVQEFLKKINKLTTTRYRLPTEVEWEYAALGGKNNKGQQFAGSNRAEEVAWVKTNSQNKVHAVGKKRANGLGLYDMTGNVWEWCEDLYYPYDVNAEQNGDMEQRVIRGACYLSNKNYQRLTHREAKIPETKLRYLGFRLASDV